VHYNVYNLDILFNSFGFTGCKQNQQQDDRDNVAFTKALLTVYGIFFDVIS